MADYGFPEGSKLGETLDRILNSTEDAATKAAEEFVDALRVWMQTDAVDAIMADIAAQGVDFRTAATTMNMIDVSTILVNAGIDDLWDDHVEAVFPRLRKLAVESLEAIGVEAADTLLDVEGMRITLEALEDGIGDFYFRDGVVLPFSARMLEGMVASLRLDTTEDIAARLRAQGYSWHHANTEARDGLAYYSNYVNEELAQEADPEGADLLRLYAGPVDAITRPFCNHVVRKAFTVAELAKADNGVPSRPFDFNNGGPRCRHARRAILNDPGMLKELGATRGEPSDIAAANKAARRRKK